jgi:hypothetical protein
MNGRTCASPLAVLGAIVLALTPSLAWSGPIGKEHQVKAAFLYNFTKFIEWPEARFASATSPIVIGLVGRDPFAGELAELVNGRQVRGRTLAVRVVRSVAECVDVHLLFVPEGGEAVLGADLSGFDAQAIVTVGESESFRAAGGMIRFVVLSGKMRFVIYHVPGPNAGVHIGPQLLKLAMRERE